MTRAFQEYGLPRVIRTDNGPPFAGTGLGSLSPLAVWWVKLGILPERIAPGHPEQNGRLERLHRTLKAETAAPPRADRRRQQQAFDRFRRSYNAERPHEALGQRPPALLYTPSFRPYPAVVGPPEYGAEVTVRRVRGNGEIKWKGDLVFVSETLKGEPVASSSRTTIVGRFASARSSSASSTTTRNASPRPPSRCYLCPRSNCYPCARSFRGYAPQARRWGGEGVLPLLPTGED